MQVGTESPEWARNLLFKWVEHDDPYYGCKITCFIWLTDYFDYKDVTQQVRIFFESEDMARDAVAGKREPGIAASYILEDKYRVIDTPVGLEEWTKKTIEDHRKINEVEG